MFNISEKEGENERTKINVRIDLKRKRFHPKSGKQILKNLEEDMNMAARKKNTSEEKEAIRVVKSQHANYKWIKHMFARQDELIARMKEVEKTVKFIKKELQKLQELRKGESDDKEEKE